MDIQTETIQMSNEMNLLLSAITKYAPLSNDTIVKMRSSLYDVLNGLSLTIEDMVVTSDPKEDCDDILMIYYILMKMKSKVWIILSGGLHTPTERLDHLKSVFPELTNVEFGIPFNNITFLEDGIYFIEKVSVFVNCGPCHSDTLFSICESLVQGGKIITVGANDDGSAAAGINQKETDEKVLKLGSWNKTIDSVRTKVTITNLSVDISRFILLPNPRKMKNDYSLMPQSCLHDVIITTAMFLSSRPPAKFAFRVNEGNSFVDLQLFPNIMDFVGTEKFNYGLSLIKEYEVTCEGNIATAVSAAIPLMVTALMGGVYKKGVFGFSPTDKKAKETVSCLTEESVPVFLSNIEKLDYFTPGYDLLAIILAQ
uniref:Uncharacterized protein n=1 Tax=viral metagenome TaxID=1070528 RepID=A0A6C0EU00_9ZZZZ